MTSGQYVRWIVIDAECATEDCGWHGETDATIDPEDRVNGMDAVWTCPNCGCERETKEGAW